MRRRIQLYLGGKVAELPDDALVLFNWAVSDVTNPAVVRNSFSQSFDLPRTPRNEAIFGHSGRMDRVAGEGGTGADFNASRKLPFAIYEDTGEILAAGYAKLDSVGVNALSVSLYGGLGEFIYNLSYDTAGEKKSLASLDYGEVLDFTIDKDTVAEAWARLGGDTSKPEKWDIINFAPAYNGIPSDFKADKALIDPELLGLDPDNLPTMDGEQTYLTKGGGYALLSLNEAADEWQAHDLRSYLQRPVLSVRKMLDAIADPSNNGGWNVDLSDLADVERLDTWLTRPLLPSLGSFKQTAGDITAAFQNLGAKTASPIGRVNLSGTIPSGTEIKVSASFGLSYQCPGVPNAVLYAHDNLIARHEQVLFVQAVAYASDNTKVAASKTKVIAPNDELAADRIALWCSYTPDPMNDGYYPTEREQAYDKSGDDFIRQRDISIEVTGQNISYVLVNIQAGGLSLLTNGQPYMGGLFATPYYKLWTDIGAEVTPASATVLAGSVTATVTSGGNLRSGATITKDILLSTSKTPAEYLLALCKSFGLYILADGASRSVQILKRSSFYRNVTTDLTERVDKSSVQIQPLSFDAKWYDFKHDSVGGRWEKEYLKTEGVQYGIQRVDTGYDFDANTKDLLSGSALKSCAAVQDRGLWWYYAYDSGTLRMWIGPLLSPGPTYSLWDSTGKNHDAATDAPNDAATFIPYNVGFPGYDLESRAEFRDGDNKPVDGADVLLVYCGDSNPDDFNLTDDTPAMDTLLGGPCWLIETNNAGLTIPQFTRYYHRGQDPYWLLDFGYPRQVDIPKIRYEAGDTVYGDCWQSYIRDRLSVNGKVMRCKVRLDGLQVGPELLRGFWWYRGSLWVLNKISNYSLTTFDPAECEFIQVRDKYAYGV